MKHWGIGQFSFQQYQIKVHNEIRVARKRLDLNPAWRRELESKALS